ncbi:hypothetical protein O6H91_03G134100 [Diphasiastrum complanatum]|uniref:Uncharacterized protein n=1 Tax=Diphasiastrum complanatum TaxID=34168 RepID=A0ACC2EC49_DIPCM|nr:hypothetical protein O6H91_03G134100 [Diphasiastrum complanatum]
MRLSLRVFVGLGCTALVLLTWDRGTALDSGRKLRIQLPRELSAVKEHLNTQELFPKGSSGTNLEDYYIADPTPKPLTPWRSGPVEHFRRPPDTNPAQNQQANAP